ncbi:Apc13p-domain-containing protein [Melanomma pulvis-pyrius CBS 109.77]|uniref:Apc13p-domain-containing protein n=1 Tax=Melanomma pulvis-pyrius CBS 109.77 TaxID=1314802 RepID=A0A6A6XN12_9PLEO|nr:Apc13p-domain-containing protein [Melanomma pulvis-pyrius CBS 109.77]
MSRDSTSTYLHLHHSHHADLLETFTHPHSSQLAPEEIYIPPHLQPLNPEDEDDVVPDQHAAFGIQRATQNKREASWRDLGLDELVRRGPGEGLGEGAGRGGASGGTGVGMRGLAQGRRDEPVRLALRRRPGAGSVGVANGNGGSEPQGSGGGAGNGLPR